MDMFLDETLQEILSRLPVRSLMQCRLVCRRLRDLTYGLHFTRIHLARTILEAKPGIILSNFVSNSNDALPYSEFCFMDRRISAPNPTFLPVQLSIPGYTKFNLLNSCNGLLFFTSNNHYPNLFVCNPFIYKFIAIPNHESPDGEHIFSVFDFGFCPKTQSYKILEMYVWRISGGINLEYCMEKYVHKLGDSSWNRIDTEVPVIIRKRSGSAANIYGALHWVDTGNGTSLTVFDLEHDVFLEMPGPLRGTGTFSTEIIQNCLSIINTHDDIVDVWIMKEYWISWEKCFVINLSSLLLPRKVEVVNYEVKESEFLVFKNYQILKYNVEEKLFKPILSIQGLHKIIPHYDTFVSPLE